MARVPPLIAESAPSPEETQLHNLAGVLRHQVRRLNRRPSRISMRKRMLLKPRPALTIPSLWSGWIPHPLTRIHTLECLRRCRTVSHTFGVLCPGHPSGLNSKPCFTPDKGSHNHVVSACEKMVAYEMHGRNFRGPWKQRGLGPIHVNFHFYCSSTGPSRSRNTWKWLRNSIRTKEQGRRCEVVIQNSQKARMSVLILRPAVAMSPFIPSVEKNPKHQV